MAIIIVVQEAGARSAKAHESFPASSARSVSPHPGGISSSDPLLSDRVQVLDQPLEIGALGGPKEHHDGVIHGPCLGGIQRGRALGDLRPEGQLRPPSTRRAGAAEGGRRRDGGRRSSSEVIVANRYDAHGTLGKDSIAVRDNQAAAREAVPAADNPFLAQVKRTRFRRTKCQEGEVRGAQGHGREGEVVPDDPMARI